ncbi:hypothetical protein [Paenibacillus glacialis]|uniref:Uncharacterized protein n=1 Tax=Paenibacillus glacialis TaxID=494026 RepID=A0A168C2S5_9BACL|nr:hypothetical protein [Paenibacillus glacialis]OAB32994.1 hypothetical protein PGLA_26305 [Paenibacillus glacialis]
MYKPRSGESYRKPQHMRYYEDFITGKLTEEIEEKYKTWFDKSQEILSGLEFKRISKRYLQILIEEQYTNSHLIDREDFWYEIPEIKKDIKKFNLFLRSLSVKTRRKVLLNMASTGMTWRDIRDCFGINPTQLSAFVKDNAKLGYNSIFLACIALLCRVPISWLLDENPDDEWDIGYIKMIPNRILSKTEFIKILQNINDEDMNKHVVKCVVLKEQGVTLNLRLEINSGGFMIEILNNVITGQELFIMSKILELFDCNYGYEETVISNRVNVTLYSEMVELPIEFQK